MAEALFNVNDIAAILYRKSIRIPVRVTRCDKKLTWVRKIHEGDSRGNDIPFLVSTGEEWLTKAERGQLVAANEQEKEEAEGLRMERLR